MNNYSRNQKIIFGLIIAAVFIASTSFTYAYFSAGISGNEEATQETVTTGNLTLLFNDGPQIGGNDIMPGTSYNKTFTVTNTGTLDTFYEIGWKSLNNNIINNEMVISYNCTRYINFGEGTEAISGSCPTILSTPIGTNTSTPINSNIYIEAGITHVYNLEVEFVETSSQQNYNQNTSFNGVLQINESVANQPLE